MSVTFIGPWTTRSGVTYKYFEKHMTEFPHLVDPSCGTGKPHSVGGDAPDEATLTVDKQDQERVKKLMSGLMIWDKVNCMRD